MLPLPLALTDGSSSQAVRQAEAWWSSLAEDDRAAVTDLCDPAWDRFFPAGGPAVVGGRFVPHDDAWGLDDWGPGWFEHLLEHPEIVIDQTPVMRTFHICTAHPAARACLAAGRVPADFACPLAAADCPMRRILDTSPRSDFRLNHAARGGVGFPVGRTSCPPEPPDGQDVRPTGATPPPAA